MTTKQKKDSSSSPTVRRKGFISFYLYESFALMCLCTVYVQYLAEARKGASDLLELKLKAAMRCHVDAGN